MNAREYFEQARQLEALIDSRLTMVTALNELATKCTPNITGMPHSSDPGKSTMADAVTKIIDLQEEINGDIDELIELKRDMVRLIKNVKNKDHRALLELRYLCRRTWEDIAEEMGYTERHIYRLHKEALESIEMLL